MLGARWRLNAYSLHCGDTNVLSLLVMSVAARPKPTASSGACPNPSSGGLGDAKEERGRAWIGCILFMLGKITGVWNNAEAMTKQSPMLHKQPWGSIPRSEFSKGVPSGQRARAIWAVQRKGMPLPQDWMDNAACRKEEGDHFSEDPRSPEYIRALRQCETCPAIGECAVLRALLARKGKPVPGIWGGIEPRIWQGANSAVTQLKNIGKKVYQE